MEFLSKIQSSGDVKLLRREDLPALCGEIRAFLIESVASTGGHLAANLGLVELTVALHRVFDTRRDRLVFDVGHQCYPHKLLTGRREQFSTLRQYGGISGFPRPDESGDDAFVAGHASTAVSAALGMARARTRLRQDYSVIALLGDGALTGGLAYEALNDAGQSGEPLIVILNDNGMSIEKNVGGMSKYFSNLRMKPHYRHFKSRYHRLILKIPGGKRIYRFLHRIKTAVKNALLPGSLFENMGFIYMGPGDGHNLEEVTVMLERARQLRRPTLIHLRTVKGRGYPPAELHPEKFHGLGPFDPATGVPLKTPAPDYSQVFGDTLCSLAKGDPRICAITPAMAQGTGLSRFLREYPRRYFDVGIAEEHAVTMAAGMAKQGMVPVCAIYSTFLQRAYDMIIHDVCLQKLHVVFAVDRAGIVGEDGPTHNGVFDVGFLTQMPHMTVYAPANFKELRTALELAVRAEGPVAVRYPRGGQGAFREDTMACPAVCLREGTDGTLVTYGRMTEECLEAVRILEGRGVSLELWKLNRLSPLPLQGLSESVGRTGRLAVAEECLPVGSLGQQLAAGMLAEGVPCGRPLFFNTGEKFLPHGAVDRLFRDCGLDGASMAGRIWKEWETRGGKNAAGSAAL